MNREAGEVFHYYPQFLPGGKDFLYLVRHNDPSKMGIAFGSLDAKPAGNSAVVAQTEFNARYDAGSRRLLYIQEGGRLVARRLELNPPRLSGDPLMVAEGVKGAPSNGYAEYSLSRNGILFYGRGSDGSQYRIGWRDRAGKPLEMIGQPFRSSLPHISLSPDSTWVAYSIGLAVFQTDIWVMDLRGLSTRVTFHGGDFPRWAPDGKFLYYSYRGGIYRKAADGSGEEVLLHKSKIFEHVYSVSPDGRALLFGNEDIMILPLTGDVAGSRKAEPYLNTDYRESSGAFSPDGRWVAYLSNESGKNEIYIQGYPDKRGKWQVSDAEGRLPVWRPDGKELFWYRLDGLLMAAAIELGLDNVRIGSPQPLFRSSGDFQPGRDGQRFMVLEPDGSQPGQATMVLVQNWAARLGK